MVGNDDAASEALHWGKPAATDRPRLPSLSHSFTLEYDCFALHPDFRLLRQWPELVPACHAAQLRIFPWTVDEPRDWRFLVDELHVDGIITNDPGKLYEWLLARVKESSRGHK
jgi:glycerophosphoryl diester phosphodiesterase